MTCIAAIVEDGAVYMAADSAGSNAAGQMMIRKDLKLFHNDEFLIGACGSFRMLQLLRYTFRPPVQDDETTVEQYMATSFVEALRECFKDGGYAQKFNEQEYAGSFLVGYRGRLFRVDNDYQIAESVDSFDSVGSGADIALGALYSTSLMSVRNRLKTALQAAERYDAFVRGPFHFATSNTHNAGYKAAGTLAAQEIYEIRKNTA